ncbi:MAG: aspartate kinase [Caldilineaceae bacterium]
MIVMKFGGTSVGSVEAFTQVAKIVKQKVAEQAATNRPGVVIVTSAMSGVTNTLIEAAKKAATTGDENAHREVQNALMTKHQTVIKQLVPDSAERAALERVLEDRLAALDRIWRGIAALGELTNRGLDFVSGMGERINAPVLAAVLRAQGLKTEAIDATELVVTDDVFGSAAPLMDQTEQRCRARILPLVQQGIVPVITGFVGATTRGTPTTLGRGASDYSAGIIGAVIDADEIQIWTDVNGVMTADPRVVPNARSLNQLSYEEVAELAYYGAKVMHPKAVSPAVAKKIPVLVLNTFEPGHPGTRIIDRSNSEAHGTVKAVTAIRGMNLITIAGSGFIGVPGTAARTFTSVASTGANVLMISQSSSEHSICFVVPEVDAAKVLEALRTEFRRELERSYIDRIDGQSNIVIVAVVGSGMRGTPGLAAGIFNAVGHHSINVIAIAQGSSEANVSLVVADADANAAVRAIHDLFELHKPTAERSSHQ